MLSHELARQHEAGTAIRSFGCQAACLEPKQKATCAMRLKACDVHVTSGADVHRRANALHLAFGRGILGVACVAVILLAGHQNSRVMRSKEHNRAVPQPF